MIWVQFWSNTRTNRIQTVFATRRALFKAWLGKEIFQLGWIAKVWTFKTHNKDTYLCTLLASANSWLYKCHFTRFWFYLCHRFCGAHNNLLLISRVTKNFNLFISEKFQELGRWFFIPKNVTCSTIFNWFDYFLAKSVNNGTWSMTFYSK